MADINKKYITVNRLGEIKKELDYLKDIKRKEIAQRIEEAKSLGDISENAEYMEAREEQAFNEGKIEELEALIRDAEIIEEKSGRKTSVSIGDSVEVKDNDGKRHVFMIVGSNEADPLNGKISNESPLGRAFLERVPGEKIITTTPMGEVEYKIIKIK